jgi:hypothetical protein
MKLFGTFNINRNVAVILRFTLFAVAAVTPILAAIVWDFQALWALVPEAALVVGAHVSAELKKTK